MGKRILILQGHPDSAGGHYCHALADAYREGAMASGHTVQLVDIASLEGLVFLTKPADFATPPPPSIQEVQKAVLDSDHIIIIFPLWVGMLPAILKAFIEHIGRANFAIEANPDGGWPVMKLKGKTAHIITTMGMPAFAYRWIFGAVGVKALESGFLKISGIKPVKRTLIGNVEGMKPQDREGWLAEIRKMAAELR